MSQNNTRKIIGLMVFIVFVAILSVTIGIGINQCKDNNIHFIINDTLENGQGKKARVILLGGQSNAAGCSHDEYLKKNVSEEKYSEYKNGYENVYINYFSTEHNQSYGFVKCATGQGDSNKLFGPELGVAEKLHELYSNEMIFIIKWAWSGSNLYEQWLSPSSNGKVGKFYKQFISYVELSLKYLISKDYDVKIEGMLWMQGESDSFSTKNATEYEFHLNNLIKDIRDYFIHYASQDGIAFIDAYISNNPILWVYCDLVNESKQKVADSSELNVVIDTNAHGLVCNSEPHGSIDYAHYDSLSEIKLGHLFAENIALFFDENDK